MFLPTVLWRRIKDWPNLEISDRGTVRNIRSGNLMKTYWHNDRQWVRLRSHNRSGSRTIERLLQENFPELYGKDEKK